jgi:hypothetical protein
MQSGAFTQNSHQGRVVSVNGIFHQLSENVPALNVAFCIHRSPAFCADPEVALEVKEVIAVGKLE